MPLRHRRTALSLLLLVPLLSGCPGQPKGAGDGSSPAPEEKPPSGKTAAGSATAPARPGEPDASIAIPSGTFVLGGPDFEDERSGRSIMLGSFAIDGCICSNVISSPEATPFESRFSLEGFI